ncbi:MAG: translation initiation factor IF-1 [Acidimicrobiia bacterium]|nr:translation initiation factor IF-1 [Acidimicrobiia bacterium]
MTEEHNVVRVQGTVVQNLANATLKVEIDGGLDVPLHVLGKMRMRRIRILPGDRVDVELSADDPRRGRFVWRYR